MALTVQLQLNPRAKPFVPTVKKANRLLQHRRRGKREEGEAPVSKHQTQLGRVRWASRRGEGEPNPPREAKTSGANGGRNRRTEVYVQKNIKGKHNLQGKGGGEGERDGVQHDDKRATTVTKLAERNSASLLITCGRWLWMGSTAWEERRRSSTCTKKWAATSSVCRKRGGAASLLFFKLDNMLLSAAVSPEAKGKGRRAKVELNWLFARVSPLPKHDPRSSSATGY